MANNNVTTNSTDLVRDTVANAVGNIVSGMEPQLHDMATKVANQAIDKSVDLAQHAVQRVQRQPWYLVGLAAVLLIGAAVLLGFQNKEEFAGANV